MVKKEIDKLTFSTGIDSLDEILRGLVRGDNVVWQMDEIDDYIHFLVPYCRRLNEESKPLIYFRFAQHKYLLPADIKADCVTLDAQEGFEQFVSEIFTVIEQYGYGACYVFDCLSELSVDWYSDRMLGNFFMLTCPYLFKYDTIAYFMLSKNQHTPFAVEAIHNTAQVVLDVFHSGDERYMLPIKVQNVNDLSRHSPTMYTLHSCKNNAFKPVTQSVVISQILASAPQPWLDFNIERRDIWAETFLEALQMNKEVYRNMRIPGRVDSLKEQLIRMIITRDKDLIQLCRDHFKMNDLISIGKRMVGTGLIGGKSAGMLLARAILRSTDNKWDTLLETHDSFFIGSDVFYTYFIENDCWWDRRALKTGDLDFERAERIRTKIKEGIFREDVVEQFKEMLNYFGQSPIIVRSSSLLEDAYGNAFSGKYESVFCANQGTPKERLRSFIDAVKTVYASTMSRDALSYRSHKDLLDKDEQMALLIQRVSGEFYDHIYFPHLAGVGYSFNPFVWNNKINAEEGVLRLVFGLGTHAVDRVGDDYTRIVAINEPLMRPEVNFDAVSKYSQKMVDLLDLKENKHTTWSFESVYSIANSVPWKKLASRNEEMEKRAKEMGMKNIFSQMLTFDELLMSGNFLNDMKEILAVLEKAYRHPVDIEFSVNFTDDEEYRINVLQCRPFQITKNPKAVQNLDEIDDSDVLMKTSGPFIGQSVFKEVDNLIYISPAHYSEMNTSQRYSVARVIGELANSFDKDANIMLIGPGRWGTTMPELGIPVSFSEIRNTSVLCELVMMHEGLVPDLSLGTHFFNDLVEMDILYMAFFPDRENYIWNRDTFENTANSLLKIKPEAKEWENAIRIIDPREIRNKSKFYLHVDTLNQKGVLYLNK